MKAVIRTAFWISSGGKPGFYQCLGHGSERAFMIKQAEAEIPSVWEGTSEEGFACHIKITDGIRRQRFFCVLGMPRPWEHAEM